MSQERALGYWVDTVCDQFLELDIDTPVRERFHASLDQFDLGPATANFLEADTQQVRRTCANIPRVQLPMFVLLQLRVGQVRIQHAGHNVLVGPGECVCIDGSEPYKLECPQLTKALALRLPADWSKVWLPRPESHAAHLFEPEGWSSALRAAVASLDVDSPHHIVPAQDAVADAKSDVADPGTRAGHRRPDAAADVVRAADAHIATPSS